MKSFIGRRKHTNRAIGLAREARHRKAVAVLGGAVGVLKVVAVAKAGGAVVVTVGLGERAGGGDGVVLGAVDRSAGRCAD